MIKIKNQKIIWDPIFSRSGFSYFIAALSFQGYNQQMKMKLGWSYRDQLLVSKKYFLTVYGSVRDQKSFRKFTLRKKSEYFKQVNTIIISELKQSIKNIVKVKKLLTASRTNTEKALDLYYKSYKNLYAVYRFPTIFDHFYAGIYRKQFISRFANTKDLCGKFFTLTDNTLLPLISSNLSKILNIPKDLTLFMNYEELKQSFRAGQAIINLSELKSRRYFYVLLLNNHKIKISTGIQAKLLLKSLKFKHKNINDILKGQTAYSGKVKGNVKLAFSIKDLKNIKSNAILVTPMTTVAYIPYIKQFSAIITDEGGLTCHAAIIAREMKISCVIGTKIATKVLKDGDKVEVDATKGTVKKL